MSASQSGILGPVPRLARYLQFSLIAGEDPRDDLRDLADMIKPEKTVVGFGQSLLSALDVSIAGMKNFPVYAEKGIEVPSTPAALWLWLKGDDRGKLVHATRQLEDCLSSAFELTDVIDAFQYSDSRDMTGYEDGTENPEGEEAIEAAIVKGAGADLDGSSFVAVQQWVHDLDAFDDMTQEEQDHAIGRRLSDNEEIDDAPESAHVKRTAQESFTPEAFVVRRSMPWADAQNTGLVFVAFGHSFDAYEALLQRMLGLEDGITDALFNFTRPVTGAFFWCPPVKDGKLNLAALKL